MTDEEILIWYEGLEEAAANTDCPEAGIIAHVRGLLKAQIAARVPGEGHDEDCHDCKERCNSLAANPSEWPIALPFPGGNGGLRWHHMGCVIKARDELEKARELLAALAGPLPEGYCACPACRAKRKAVNAAIAACLQKAEKA